VETAGQLELAAELGCTFAQGFFIARPMPAEGVLPWIDSRPSVGPSQRPRVSSGSLLHAGR
jgi:EAL domain-containing protein (putative c-di-GMP-specific phosphodiesterase class I)